MRNVWIVTPSWRRYALSAITMRQHRQALINIGEDPDNVLIVADDFNVDLARSLGVGYLHCKNHKLGRKFNDGVQYAVDVCDATHVVPVGSDSFVDLSFIAEETRDYVVTVSQNYAVVRSDGKERMHLQMNATTYALPAAAIKGVRDICDPTIERGCDTSMLNNAISLPEIDIVYSESHPLETVGFQSRGNQVSDYDAYYEMWGVAKTDDPFDANLYHYYPRHLVDAVKDVYADAQL